ncbi:MAG: FHA domain-containing protein [Halioglobus sp.]|nr:FHA domain-containing protein [Halioglobus sp.]
MTRAAVHLNDAGITLLTAERVLYRQPGFALLAGDQLATGTEAFLRARINPRHLQHRHWMELATATLKEQHFAHLSSADLVSRQLEQMWRIAGDGIDDLVMAVPAFLDSTQLGLILGIAMDIGIPVTAMSDAAIAATRREYRNAVPVHIDCSLHATTLTRIAQGNGAKVEVSEVLDSCGTYVLYDVWLRTIAEAFVRQSRFDPLHTADTEQMLLDQLGHWLGEASRAETVSMSVSSGAVTHRAEIESLSLVAAAAPWYQQIVNRLRALFRADEVPAIQITARVAGLPGLADLLLARVGGEIYALEAGATARGALARCRGNARPGGSVSLLRHLPWDQAAVEVRASFSGAASSGAPSHLLFGDVAWQIGERPLLIGSQADPGARFIELDGDMPGLSRRHCEIRRENGQCVVEDHSRYGSFLNGHRVSGSAVLQVGDSLRLGTPGFEFRLITTDESHGA